MIFEFCSSFFDSFSPGIHVHRCTLYMHMYMYIQGEGESRKSKRRERGSERGSRKLKGRRKEGGRGKWRGIRGGEQRGNEEDDIIMYISTRRTHPLPLIQQSVPLSLSAVQ